MWKSNLKIQIDNVGSNSPPFWFEKGWNGSLAYQLSSCRAVCDLDTVCDGAASLGVHRAPRFPPCCLRDVDDALVCFPPRKTTFSRCSFVFPGPRSYFYCRRFNGHKRWVYFCPRSSLLVESLSAMEKVTFFIPFSLSWHLIYL